MPIPKTKVPGTKLLIQEERLSSLCKVFREGEDKHFAQVFVQTGMLGEAVLKGLDSPNLRFKERRDFHHAIWWYAAVKMGYKTGTLQRVKRKPKLALVTVKKSLNRYK